MKHPKCVICGEKMTESRRTCNAMPVREGRCCLFCDNMLVTPFRMALAGMKQHANVLWLVRSLQQFKELTIKITLEDKSKKEKP